MGFESWDKQDIKIALASDFWKEVKEYIFVRQNEIKNDLLTLDLTSDANRLKAVKLQSEYEAFRKVIEEISSFEEVYT